MKFKKVAALVLSLIVTLSSFVSSYADDISIADDALTIGISDTEFTGVIKNENSSGVKDVKIDIYSYVLEEETDECKIFRNVYDSSVYTDNEGSYKFDRPEGAFLMKVDLSTLPGGTGISNETIHIDEVENTTTLNVDNISSIDVQVNDIVTEDILVEFKSDTEQVLYTDYNISVNPTESEALVATFANLNDTDETSGINSLDYLITVEANGLMYSETYTVALPSDPIDKIDSLNYYQKISDDQRIVLLNEALQSDTALSIFDKIDIETEINDYCLSNPAFVEENSSVLVATYSLTKPTYANEATYPDSTNTSSNFIIHYESGAYSKATLQAYLSTLDGARNMFVNNYGFLPPIPADNTNSKYDVYLMYDANADAAATTKHVGTSSSYIIFNAPTNYTTSHDYTKTIAHELFHAISYRYTYENGITPEKWFSESFANWAGLLYVGRNTGNLTSKVSLFLKNPAKSLHDLGVEADGDDGRHYGAFLFPLTIQNQYGGPSAIKSIMESFKDCTNGTGVSYSAISKGLGKVNSSYNRSKAFVYCMVNNMFTSEYYPISNGAWKSVTRTASYIGSKTITNIKPAAMACRYYDFFPSSTSKYLYVTLENTNASDSYANISIACVKEKTNDTYYRYSKGISSAYTYEFNNFSQSASKRFTIALINSKTNATQNLKFTATYKATES